MIGKPLSTVAILLAVLLSSRSAAASPPAGTRAPSIRLAEPHDGGAVPLADASIVLWDSSGRVQIRMPSGVWSAILPLGLDTIETIVPDELGFLLWGAVIWTKAMPPGALEISHNVILLLSPTGKVLDRWDPCASTSSIAGAGAKRFATGRGTTPRRRGETIDPEKTLGPETDKVFELKPGGRVDTSDTIEVHGTIATLAVGPSRSFRVDCVPVDSTKVGFHLPYCSLAGTGGWRESGFWDQSPFACGPYLLEVLGNADALSPTTGQQPHVVVRRLDNGAIAGERRLAAGAAVACGGPGELLVGTSDVQGLSLPDLAPRWRAPSRRGRVVAVVRSGAEVFAATASGAWLTLHQPQITQATHPDR